jgi:hypothetical protein
VSDPVFPGELRGAPILEIADRSVRIELEFEVRSERRRANSLHKLDTLIAALRVLARGSRRSSPSTTAARRSSRS